MRAKIVVAMHRGSRLLQTSSEPSHRQLKVEMHYAWEIEEIATMVVINLDRTALANFALVSRLFNVLAVPCIWSDIDGRRISRLTYSALEDLESNSGSVDVKRLRTLAACVRNLHLDLYDAGSLFIPHFMALLSSSSAFYVFPNLCSLSYKQSDWHCLDLHNALPFISPSLQNLTVLVLDQPEPENEYAFDKAMGSLLHTVQLRCLHLTSLTLAGDRMPRSGALYGRIMQDLLAQRSSLEYFHGSMTALYGNILPILARLPRLSHFAVQQSECDEDFVNEQSLCVMRSGFLALRSLGLRVFRFPLAGKLLSGVVSRVEVLELTIASTYHNESAEQELVQFCGCVALFSATLKTLRLKIDAPWRNSIVVCWRSLSPLLRCSLLKSFHLHLALSKPFDFVDCDLVSIAKGFRALKSLVIDWTSGHNRDYGTEGGRLLLDDQLTLSGLAAVAQYCEDIEELQISGFNGTDIPRAPTSRPTDRVSLTVHYPVLEQPDLVAAFLLTLWPRIRIVRSVSVLSDRGSWQLVEEEVERRQRLR